MENPFSEQETDQEEEAAAAAAVSNVQSEPRPTIAQSNEWLQDWVSQNPSLHSQLVTTSSPESVLLGTGHEILTSASAFIQANIRNELIFVTCFWARSPSLTTIINLLESLSKKALSQHRTIRVRISISSLSLLQKLFHTRSPHGYVYARSEWEPKLGIPSSIDLSGLDLQIKSVFVTPFSVLHSKFILLDTDTALVPSCNVSWEDWLEGCIQLRGAITSHFRSYWQATWATQTPPFTLPASPPGAAEDPTTSHPSALSPLAGSTPLARTATPVKTVFLPHPHHANPRFRPFPCQRPPAPPQTPLNTFTLQLLDSARHEIVLQTPNVTAAPVLDAILRAAQRGVHTTLVTNERLMVNEQLVTAGTTTPRCLGRLARTYRLLAAARRRGTGGSGGGGGQLGRITVEYFVPGPDARSGDGGRRAVPVSSHVKATVVDGAVVLFGSGNMDRASWFTSQEVGVAVCEGALAGVVREMLLDRDAGCTRVCYELG